MKKIIITENQLQMVVNTLINEQHWIEQPTVIQQMKTIKPAPNGKYCFTKEIYNMTEFKLHLVKPNETLETIIGNDPILIKGALYVNKLLQNNPKNLRAGDVIAISLRPTGGDAEG